MTTATATKTPRHPALDCSCCKHAATNLVKITRVRSGKSTCTLACPEHARALTLTTPPGEVATVIGPPVGRS